MRETTTKGVICLDDEFGFVYKIAFISYTLYEDDSYTYRFDPVYSVIDMLPPSLFQGIPGLDLDTRKKTYVRENLVPVFISERTPGENRQNLWQLLEEVGMDHLNRLEWLIRTDTVYSGDLLYVRRHEAGDEKQAHHVGDIRQFGRRAVQINRKLLEIICYGDDLFTPQFIINDETRGIYYPLLMALYMQEKSYAGARMAQGIRKAAQEGKYKGRRPIAIDDTRLDEIMTGYREGRITSLQAMNKLNVSRSTFFRRLRNWKSGSRMQPGQQVSYEN